MTNSKDPLHGVTLEMILNRLVEYYGWDEMGRQVGINCFNYEPTITSSLRFLRKESWARGKVEKLYLRMISEKQRSTPESPENAQG